MVLPGCTIEAFFSPSDMSAESLHSNHFSHAHPEFRLTSIFLTRREMAENARAHLFSSPLQTTPMASGSHLQSLEQT